MPPRRLRSHLSGGNESFESVVSELASLSQSTEPLNQTNSLLNQTANDIDAIHDEVTVGETSGGDDDLRTYGRNIRKTQNVEERVEEEMKDRVADLRRLEAKSTSTVEQAISAASLQLLNEKLEHYITAIQNMAQEVSGAKSDILLAEHGKLIPIESKDLDIITQAQQNVVNLQEELKEIAYLYNKYKKDQMQAFIDSREPGSESLNVAKQVKKRIEESLKYGARLTEMSIKLARIRNALQQKRREGVTSRYQQSRSTRPIFVALKNDPRFRKYFQLLAKKTPKETIKAQMTKEGYSPQILDMDPNQPAPKVAEMKIQQQADYVEDEINKYLASFANLQQRKKIWVILNQKWLVNLCIYKHNEAQEQIMRQSLRHDSPKFPTLLDDILSMANKFDSSDCEAFRKEIVRRMNIQFKLPEEPEQKDFLEQKQQPSVAAETKNDAIPLKEHPVYGKYFDLLSKGASKEQVKLTMSKIGLDTNIIDMNPDSTVRISPDTSSKRASVAKRLSIITTPIPEQSRQGELSPVSPQSPHYSPAQPGRTTLSPHAEGMERSAAQGGAEPQRGKHTQWYTGPRGGKYYFHSRSGRKIYRH